MQLSTKRNEIEMNDNQPEALRLADALEQGKYLLSVERDATAAELRRLHQCEIALRVFMKKTQWVQDVPQSGELGMHYADILRVRIEKLERVNTELLEALRLVMVVCAGDIAKAPDRKLEMDLNYGDPETRKQAYALLLCRAAIAKAEGRACA
jgi:hypothetical protein